ncbi:hypothetical protein CRD64_02550 [Streptococcus pneumoniae]|nr:hypothetical protein CRD64_02550 [Streptococcus pneumoniae]
MADRTDEVSNIYTARRS